MSSEPQSTTAWAKGARAERLIGRELDKLRLGGCAVLHDRTLPRSRANIDHIVISPAGVFVVDTKHYRGRVEQRDVGGWFRRDLRLYVAGHNRTKLIAAMSRQVEIVRAILSQTSARTHAPVTGALLFMSEENWPLYARRPLRFGDVYATWGRALGKMIRGGAVLAADDVPELERLLAAALPAAR